MFTFVLCSGSRLQRYNLAQAMSSISLYFFIFSILFFNFALATVRNAPTLNTLQRSCAIKREWGESPRLSRSCEPPLSTGANERTTEAMHLRAECVGMARMPYPPIKLFAECVGMAGMPYPPMKLFAGCVGMAGCHTLLCFGKVFASGRRVRRPAETHLPMESSLCASRIGRV